jgi:ERCC4-type nuclease
MTKNEFLNEIEIIIDTREHEDKIKHIVDKLKNLDVKYKYEKLQSADYGFKINGHDLEICLVERKKTLGELSQNLTKHRDRFIKEFERSKDKKIMILIEDESLTNIYKGKYSSKLNINSFIGLLFTFQHKYNIHIVFIEKEYVIQTILNYFYYWRCKDEEI